jgi:hypothetical protein
MTLNRIVATMNFDTSAEFIVLLVALLTSSLVMWREEHLWNFSVLQRVHIYDHVNLCTHEKNLCVQHHKIRISGSRAVTTFLQQTVHIQHILNFSGLNFCPETLN